MKLQELVDRVERLKEGVAVATTKEREASRERSRIETDLRNAQNELGKMIAAEGLLDGGDYRITASRPGYPAGLDVVAEEIVTR